jgi:hypothetical protein
MLLSLLDKGPKPLVCSSYFDKASKLQFSSAIFYPTLSGVGYFLRSQESGVRSQESGAGIG